MPTIKIRVKAAGKRKPLIDLLPLEVPADIADAHGLIAWIVRDNVRKFNEKAIDTPLVDYLTQAQIEDAAQYGKVGFGERRNDRAQDAEAAVKNALQAFDDGLYRIVINDLEIGPASRFNLKDDDVLTFIRLVMLAGRLW